MSFYFDNAATTFPKPAQVYDAMDSFYRTCGGSAERGQYKRAAESTKIIFETRENIKRLLDCPNKDVIFSPSATIALNIIIQGLIKTYPIKNVWISPFEHNAVTRILENYKSQIQVNILPLNADFTYSLETMEKLFNQHKPDLLILSHASNVCGLICPVQDLCGLAKKFNAITVLDMAQSAALVPVNLANEHIDFAVFEGHKTLLGPFGAGGFVKSKEVLLEPVLFGGTGTESANQNMPQEIPHRYEPGTQNVQAIAGLHAALQWRLLNQEDIRAKEEENHKRLFEILSGYDFIKIVGPKNRFNVPTKCVGVISALFEGYSADEIGNVLDNFDVAVRCGLHCAPLAHKTLNTFPAGTVRFSVQYFTNEKDFLGLEKALEYIRENR